MKVIWITGASSGIGEALVHVYALEPNNYIILSSRTEKELERVKEESKLGDRGFVLPLDLENEKSFQDRISKAITKWGKVDILIGNGGISQRDLAENTSMDVVRRIMETNYFGNVALSLGLLPHFLQNKKGNYAIISSVAGKTGTRYRSAYSASKHALHGFYDSLRAETHDRGIRISIICPGYVKTKVSLNALEGSGNPHNKMDDVQARGLDPFEVAKKIQKAIEKNQEEVVIGGFQEHMGALLKRFWPSFLSWKLRSAKVT
jgi:short-subunit dehydrogenase